MNLRFSLLALSIASLFGIVCSSESSDQRRLENMEARIVNYVGDAPCEGVDDCRYIAFGAKPCGGPWKYLIYSSGSVDSVDLSEMVARYNRFNDELNHRYGWRSDCAMAPKPTLGCVEGKCVDLLQHQ